MQSASIKQTLMALKMIFMIVPAILLLATPAYAQFEGYQLLRIEPKTDKQIELVGHWQHNEDFDIWSTKYNHIDVALSPDALRKYLPFLNENDVQYKTLNKNIQNTFEEEQKSIVSQKNYLKSSGKQARVVNTFASHGDINNWMTSLAASKQYLSTFISGKTFENRDLLVLKFNSPNATAGAIWIDCGVHAREWISISTCVYMIDAFIKEYNTSRVQKIVNRWDIYFLPVHNPDGYEFSRSTNRMWRKNRRVNPGSECRGVDINRNFGYKWMVGGASNNPCSETYAGPTADSELETQAVENVIKSRNDWSAFITIHTYGLFWFTPWGFTSELPLDYVDLEAKSKIGAKAAKAVYGTEFAVGSSTRLLYIAAGGSDDWAKGVAGIKYAHCLELRPGSTGEDSSYGFQLPVDRAPKAGEETYRGISAFLNAI